VLVATNEAQIGLNDIGTGTQEAQAGRGRPLAVTGPRRLPAFPNVPTFNELGHGELFVPFRLGIAAPIATPAPVITRISAAVTSAMQTPEARDTFAKAGLDVLALSPQETARRVAAEAAFFMSIAKKAGIVGQ
jgi:tripartite-type tricarboxylate transporter receptor subunit TctC